MSEQDAFSGRGYHPGLVIEFITTFRTAPHAPEEANPGLFEHLRQMDADELILLSSGIAGMLAGALLALQLLGVDTDAFIARTALEIERTWPD